MVKPLFDHLLEECGKAMGIPTLHPDKNNSCLINFPNGLQIQIEMDSQASNILLGCHLGLVPSGRYRENIFREALKTNGLSSPAHGILAYSQKTEHLVLFEYINTKDLSGEKIADEIKPFTDKALMWKSALDHGEIPVVSNIHTSSGMFGLHP